MYVALCDAAGPSAREIPGLANLIKPYSNRVPLPSHPRDPSSGSPTRFLTTGQNSKKTGRIRFFALTNLLKRTVFCRVEFLYAGLFKFPAGQWSFALWCREFKLITHVVTLDVSSKDLDADYLSFTGRSSRLSWHGIACHPRKKVAFSRKYYFNFGVTRQQNF